MPNLNEQVKQIMELMDLRLNPQAVKMIEREDQIPASAVWAGRDIGQHMAFCQAMALTKREGKTIYMERKDHWCWAPLVGFGHVDCSPEAPSFEEITKNLGIADLNEAKQFFQHFPMLPLGKYIGTVVAPAQSADFEPDVVLFNCDNNFQLRSFIFGIKNQTGKMLDVSLDAIDSCIYTIVKPMLDGEYAVAIPDPGEQERALTDKNEIILGVPASRMEELLTGCQALSGMKVGYRDMKMEMMYDYVRPPFYNRLFELWGLGQGRTWDRGGN